jgi:branched-chain amino acid transport system substrate-binding protein
VGTGWNSSQPRHSFGEWACGQGSKKIAVIAADHAFSYEVAGGFQNTFVLQFAKQVAAAGNKKPVNGAGTGYDGVYVPFNGRRGHRSCLGKYSAALDTPVNAAFVKEYRAKTARSRLISQTAITPPPI